MRLPLILPFFATVSLAALRHLSSDPRSAHNLSAVFTGARCVHVALFDSDSDVDVSGHLRDLHRGDRPVLLSQLTEEDTESWNNTLVSSVAAAERAAHLLIASNVSSLQEALWSSPVLFALRSRSPALILPLRRSGDWGAAVEEVHEFGNAAPAVALPEGDFLAADVRGRWRRVASYPEAEPRSLGGLRMRVDFVSSSGEKLTQLLSRALNFTPVAMHEEAVSHAWSPVVSEYRSSRYTYLYSDAMSNNEIVDGDARFLDLVILMPELPDVFDVSRIFHLFQADSLPALAAAVVAAAFVRWVAPLQPAGFLPSVVSSLAMLFGHSGGEQPASVSARLQTTACLLGGLVFAGILQGELVNVATSKRRGPTATSLAEFEALGIPIAVSREYFVYLQRIKDHPHVNKVKFVSSDEAFGELKLKRAATVIPKEVASVLQKFASYKYEDHTGNYIIEEPLFTLMYFYLLPRGFPFYSVFRDSIMRLREADLIPRKINVRGMFFKWRFWNNLVAIAGVFVGTIWFALLCWATGLIFSFAIFVYELCERKLSLFRQKRRERRSTHETSVLNAQV